MNRNDHYPFINTPLPYSYDALEPFIDEKTMCLHHDRHLRTYIDNLNRFLEENPSLQKFSLEELLSMWRRLPCHLSQPEYTAYLLPDTYPQYRRVGACLLSEAL